MSTGITAGAPHGTPPAGPRTSALVVQLRVVAGEFALGADFTAPAVGVTGIFGASGSGKTTLLRAIAGLDRGAGAVRIGDAVWQDDAARVFVLPGGRDVGWVAQEPDLFPHLTVADNLGFAARRRPVAAAVPDDARIVAQTGIDGLLHRMPHELSGGERQRVAIARALVAAPRVLLMDEPVSALDEPSRRALLDVIVRASAAFSVPVLYVSHSLAEVSRVADRLVWLADGTVRASGAVAEVLAEMDFGRWRGDDAGVVVDATVRDHDDAWATTTLDSPWGEFVLRRNDAPRGARVRLQVLASDVSLGLSPQTDSSIANEFAVRISAVEEVAPGEMLVRMTPRGGGNAVLLAKVMRRSAERLALAPGRDAYARVKAAAVLG